MCGLITKYIAPPSNTNYKSNILKAYMQRVYSQCVDNSVLCWLN